VDSITLLILCSDTSAVADSSGDQTFGEATDTFGEATSTFGGDDE